MIVTFIACLMQYCYLCFAEFCVLLAYTYLYRIDTLFYIELCFNVLKLILDLMAGLKYLLICCTDTYFKSYSLYDFVYKLTP